MIDIQVDEQQRSLATIKVIGVGGAGGNTVNSIVDSNYERICCISANTDAQALEQSRAHHKVQLGVKSTKGLGTGANPDLGKHAAEEDLDKVMGLLTDADVVFLTAGMGGGTGSGALPVIARALKDEGILSIAIVTKPFAFEGKRRTQVANNAIELLKNEVDTLIVIPNQRLLEVVDQNASMIESFSMINQVLGQAVKGIADIITKPGHINVDFADVRTIMKGMGMAVMGTGVATGPGRAREAALKAISSPLLENITVQGAQSMLINITGGPQMRLHELSEAASLLYEQASDNAHIILGSVIDENMGEELMVTVIATGFEKQLAANSNIQLSGAVQTIIQDTVTSQETPQQVFEQKNEEAAVHGALKIVERESAETPILKVDEHDLDVPSCLRKQDGL